MNMSKQGFTLVEIMLAMCLLAFAALVYCAALIQGQQVATMSGRQMQAMHIARDILEQIADSNYNDIQSISPTVIDGGYTYKCTVSNAEGLTDTKDVVVQLAWIDSGAGTTSSIEVATSFTKWMHQ